MMTDAEIRDVFVELRRISVDLARPPGLALGTGFGDGEFLPWLRSLPDNVGHETFVDELDARIASATPNVLVAGAPVPAPRRYMPTVEQVHAAMDILIREWDPLGARLGELGRDDVAIPAYNAVYAIVLGGPTPLVETQVASKLRATEREVFGVRAAPLIQTRYLVRRIMQVVAENPGPPHEFDPWERLRAVSEAESAGQATAAAGANRSVRSSRRTVRLGPRGDEPPAFDPVAVCDECGTTGTVAWVTRDIEPRLSRYCADCWRRLRDRYAWPVDMPDKETPEGVIAIFEHVYEHAREMRRGSGSALWEDKLGLVRSAMETNEQVEESKREHFRKQLARHLADLAPQMYGPMPDEIEAFVQRYNALDP